MRNKLEELTSEKDIEVDSDVQHELDCVIEEKNRIKTYLWSTMGQQ